MEERDYNTIVLEIDRFMRFPSDNVTLGTLRRFAPELIDHFPGGEPFSTSLPPPNELGQLARRFIDMLRTERLLITRLAQIAIGDSGIVAYRLDEIRHRLVSLYTETGVARAERTKPFKWYEISSYRRSSYFLIRRGVDFDNRLNPVERACRVGLPELQESKAFYFAQQLLQNGMSAASLCGLMSIEYK